MAGEAVVDGRGDHGVRGAGGQVAVAGTVLVGDGGAGTRDVGGARHGSDGPGVSNRGGVAKGDVARRVVGHGSAGGSSRGGCRHVVAGRVGRCARAGEVAGGRVRRGVVVAGGGKGHAHALAEVLELLLEHVVAAHELLDSRVTAPLTPELINLGLEALDMLLGPGADGPLCLPVVGPLASQLGGSQSRDAAGT